MSCFSSQCLTCQFLVNRGNFCLTAGKKSSYTKKLVYNIQILGAAIFSLVNLKEKKFKFKKRKRRGEKRRREREEEKEKKRDEERRKDFPVQNITSRILETHYMVNAFRKELNVSQSGLV